MSIIIPLAAIASISILELVALKKGINGKALLLSTACIAGLGGFGVSELVHLIGS